MTAPGGTTASGLEVVLSAAAEGLGASDPIVALVHGAMDRSTSFGRAVRLLDDLPVLRYDRRGYGRSTGLGVADLDGHVGDLLEVLDGRPAVVVGHSIGGVVALVAAQRRPDQVRAVGAWEAPMPWAPWWPTSSAGGVALASAGDDGPGDVAERFMRRMVGDERWARLPARTRSDRRAEGPALLADLGSLRRSGAPYDAGALRQPVIAGCGTASVDHHRRAAHELAGAAAHGTLVEVADAGHGCHLSDAPAFAGFVRAAAAAAAGVPWSDPPPPPG